MRVSERGGRVYSEGGMLSAFALQVKDVGEIGVPDFVDL